MAWHLRNRETDFASTTPVENYSAAPSYLARMEAIVPSGAAGQAGDASMLRIGFDTSQLHLFDPESGERIPGAAQAPSPDAEPPRPAARQREPECRSAFDPAEIID